MRKLEHCRNPWNGRYRKTDIAVYIVYKGRKLPICRECWGELAEKPVEWGEQSGPRRG